MRCSDCAAWNVAEAAWCTQCYRRFDEPVATEAPATEPAATEAPATAEAAGDAPQVPSPTPRAGAAPSAGDRGVRMQDGVVEWRCHVCEAWAPLDAVTCAACGSPRRGFGPAAETRPVATDAPILVTSALLPGLGHLLAGRTGSGVARLGLTLLWLVGGIAIILADARAVARLPGLVLLLGVLALWAGTVLDASALQRGGSRELLDGRALLWLVVGVTGGLVIALFVATVAGVQVAGQAA